MIYFPPPPKILRIHHMKIFEGLSLKLITSYIFYLLILFLRKVALTVEPLTLKSEPKDNINLLVTVRNKNFNFMI